MSLAGSAILVIGGSSGIGSAVASAALAEGAEVTIASSNADKLERAAQRLRNVETVCMDVTCEAAVDAFFSSSRSFNHIVFTAGDWDKLRRTAFFDLDIAAAASLFQVRFWGAMTVAKHGAKRLLEGGSLILTNGMTAIKPEKGSAVAAGMAGSVEHLVKGLAVELAPLRVNGVCPGAVRTEAWDRLPDGLRERQMKRLRHQLIPRVGEPEEIAEAYLYLMRGNYTTGQILRVEGGWELGG